MKTLFLRFLRVFLAGALVGGWAALQGDTEFLQFLGQYAGYIAGIAAVAKFLRSRFGWTWLPF